MLEAPGALRARHSWKASRTCTGGGQYNPCTVVELKYSSSTAQSAQESKLCVSYLAH